VRAAGRGTHAVACQITSPQAGISFAVEGEVPGHPGARRRSTGRLGVAVDGNEGARSQRECAGRLEAGVSGRMPSTEHGGRRWFRRRDIEMFAAANSFRARQQAARPLSPGGHGLPAFDSTSEYWQGNSGVQGQDWHREQS
jgi:hypothetical protein